MRDPVYDANGNIIQMPEATGTAHLSWDIAGRLKQVDVCPTAAPCGSWVGRYVYDGFARRRLKESAGAEARRFHYDLAGNLIEEAGPDGNARRAWVYVNGHRVAMVRPTAAALVIPPINCQLPCGSIASEADAWATWVLATLAVLAIMGRRRTGWAVASVAATVVVVQCAGDGAEERIANAVTVPGVDVYYYHNDHLDTPRALTDESGAVVWSATYSAFGRRTITGTSVEQPFVFPGQYADAETGLYYNWHRYYNPVWGRYVSADPFGQAGSIILYDYAYSNPLVFYDDSAEAPSGGNSGTGQAGTNESCPAPPLPLPPSPLRPRPANPGKDWPPCPGTYWYGGRFPEPTGECDPCKERCAICSRIKEIKRKLDSGDVVPHNPCAAIATTMRGQKVTHWGRNWNWDPVNGATYSNCVQRGFIIHELFHQTQSGFMSTVKAEKQAYQKEMDDLENHLPSQGCVGCP